MLIDDALYSLLYNNYEQFLIAYSRIADKILFCSEQSLRALTTELTLRTKRLANRFYDTDHIIDKRDLLSIRWDSAVPYFDNITNGSTGTPFSYRIWKNTYNNIESINHYRLIANEFDIRSNPNILMMILSKLQIDEPLIFKHTTSNPILSHGYGQSATVHQVQANTDFVFNYYKFYEQIIDYIYANDIDIILADGDSISSLTWNIKRLKIHKPLAKLISNTNSRIPLYNVEYLKNNGLVNDWVDHMRCWDGGVTFFTCKHYTYHLHDGLANSYCDNQRLVSHDYFSLPFPFYNYWNGDYAEIQLNYKRCNCGRLYRPFKLSRTRDYVVPLCGNSLTITNRLKESHLCQGLKRVHGLDSFLRIYTLYSLPQTQKDMIKSLFPNFFVQFTVEEQIG